MRIYVICRQCGKRIYFAADVRYRYELPNVLTIRCQDVSCPIRGQDQFFYPHQVTAVEGLGKAVGGAVALGALGGLIGGPVGAAIGAAVGGAAGKNDPSESEKVRRFNQS